MPDNFYDINTIGGIGADFDNFQKLRQDTQERINNTLNPDLSLPNVINKTDSLSDIISGQTESIEKMLYSGDRYKVQFAANIIANSDNQTNRLYKQGVGGDHQIKYDPSQEKYLNSKFGYDYSSTPEENEQWNYDYVKMKNSTLGRYATNVGHFISNVGEGTVVKLGEGLGYMGAMIGSIGQDNYFQHVADNAFTRQFEDWDETFKSKVLPIWHDKDFANKGFFAQMGDEAFWSEQVADGVAFMVSAVLTNELGGWLFGGIAKLAGLGDIGATAIDFAGGLSKYGKVLKGIGTGVDFLAETFTGAKDLGGVGAWALSTSSEAAFEAAGVYKETYKDLTDSGNYTDEQAQTLASQRASHDFKGNLLALSLSNAFENKMIFEPIRAKFLGRAIQHEEPTLTNGIMSEFDKDVSKSLNLTNKFDYKYKYSKFLDLKNPNSFLRFYGTRALTTSVMEGLYEENVQLAIERLSRYGSFDNTNEFQDIASTGKQMYAQTLNALNNKDDIRKEDVLSKNNLITKDENGNLVGTDAEAASSIGMGALIGVLGTGFTAKFIANERKNNIKSINLNVENYNAEKTKFLSVNDVFKQKDDGSYEVENNKLVYDPLKLKARAEGLTHQLNRQVTVDQLEDPQSRKLLQDVIFSDYIHATMNAGMQDQLKTNLRNLDKQTPEQLLQLGFNADDIQTTPSQLLSKADQLIEAHKKAFDTKVRNSTELSEKDFQTVDYNRKYQLYNTEALKSAVGVQLNDLTSTIENYAEKNYTENDPINSSLVDQYNASVFQKVLLEQFQSVNDHSDFYKDYIKRELDKLNSQIKSSKTDLKDNIEKGGYKEDSNGFLVNNFIDEDHYDVIRKQSGYKNSLSQFNFITDSLSNTKKGVDNYNNYINHLQEGNRLEQEANREFTLEGKDYKKSELNDLFAKGTITKEQYESALDNEKGIEKPKEEIPVSKVEAIKNKFVDAFNELKTKVQAQFKNVTITQRDPNSLLVDVTQFDENGNKIPISQELRNTVGKEKAKLLEELNKDTNIINDDNELDVNKLFTNKDVIPVPIEDISPTVSTSSTSITTVETPVIPLIIPFEPILQQVEKNTPGKAVSFDTPMMSAKKDTKEDTNKQEEEIIPNEYTTYLNTFIKEANFNNFNFFIEQDSEKHRPIYNFQDKEKIESTGQIIKVYNKDGTPTTFRNAFGLRFLPKNIENLPIITSFNQILMTKEDPEQDSKAKAKADASKGELTQDDVLQQYADDLKILIGIRKQVESTNQKIQIYHSIVNKGIHPITSTDSVINRFGKDFTIKLKTQDGEFGDSQIGSIVADFGNAQFITPSAKQIFNIPALFTTLTDVMNITFTDDDWNAFPEGKIQKAIQFLSSYIQTNANNFFFPVKTEEGYKINFFSVSEKGRHFTQAIESNRKDISTEFLNINKTALKDGILGFEGNNVLSANDYQQFAKENVTTNRKKVTKNGKIFTDTVNPSFSFNVEEKKAIEKVQDDINKEFNKSSKNINEYTNVEHAQKDLQAFLKNEQLMKDKYGEERFNLLKQQLVNKIEQLTPEEEKVTSQDELMRAFRFITPIIEKQELVQKVEPTPIINEPAKVVAKQNQDRLNRLNNFKNKVNTKENVIPPIPTISYNKEEYKMEGNKIINITKNEILVDDKSDTFNILSKFAESSQDGSYKLAIVPITIKEKDNAEIEKTLDYKVISLPSAEVIIFDENNKVVVQDNLKEIATEEGKKNIDDLLKCN